ncbi:purine-nucleoside phosphorylase [Candidatus Roizmanbacteria bacterium]|nr:purine-nucleoside phosphorylase [Candidatus Roizmanbacteria bacterium]
MNSNSPIGLILGSGWGGIRQDLQNAKEDSFEKIFGRRTSVVGHAGKAIFGSLFGKKLVILSGRFHTYEAYTSAEAVRTVRFLHEKKVKKIIITSASGALNPKYQVGDLVILHDMITIFCQSPLTGSQFQNLSQPFSQKLIEAAEKSSFEAGIPSQKGVYIYVKGPHYETFSDKMALRFLGADVVGMSTVPEVIMANHLGMEVLGLSMVTNLAFVKHDHKEVLKTMAYKKEKLGLFFKRLIQII